tara:strand:+ start:989 stop:1318 length:330 start_codon:yes stop_codon:yes gene_type:complete
MSENEIDYGKLTKRILFTDNDHRHAKLTIKLKQDGITQSYLFRAIITGYLEEDLRIRSFIDEQAPLSKVRKNKATATRLAGQQIMKDFALNEGDIENIFDILEEEFPDL